MGAGVAGSGVVLGGVATTGAAEGLADGPAGGADEAGALTELAEQAATTTTAISESAGAMRNLGICVSKMVGGLVVTTMLRGRVMPGLCARTNVNCWASERTRASVTRRRRSASGYSGVDFAWRRCASYGAVPTRVLPVAESAALKVSEVLPLNFGPYSFFWPL